MRTRVKICGITRLEDAFVAASLGADAIGLVFYAGSPRCIDIEQARSISAQLPPFVARVGLFVDAPVDDVARVAGAVGLDVLQFHGAEPAAYCRSFSIPYIKALRMTDDVDLADAIEQYPDCRGVLLDAYHPVLPGGTGNAFDWNRIPEHLDKPVILAGGLSALNVGEAIKQVRPYAVDISSGVESEKGIKDKIKLAAFFKAVQESN